MFIIEMLYTELIKRNNTNHNIYCVFVSILIYNHLTDLDHVIITLSQCTIS